MSILGINNRTENWKTARHFAPLLLNRYARTEVARKLGEDASTLRADVGLELFWKGLRDYVDKVGKSDALRTKCAETYKKLFSPLRSDIEKFNEGPPRNRLRPLNDSNYDLSKETGEKGLWANLYNTEIDIVLETPGHLFIGEAKEEAGLGTDGNYVLVHQLIRQYVTARILLRLKECDKEVVPFLVVEDGRRDRVLNTGQVGFMIDRKWLRKKHVLTWGCIEGLRA